MLVFSRQHVSSAKSRTARFYALRAAILSPVLFSLFFLFAVFARGLSAAPVDVSASEVELLPLARILAEPGTKMSFDELIKLPPARPASNRKLISFGYSDQAYLFLIRLKNPGKRKLRRLLVLRPSWLDRLDLTFVDPDGRETTRQGGDLLPFRRRAVEHRFANFMLEIPPGESRLLVRTRTTDPYLVQMTLWEKSAFFRADGSEKIYLGFIYGILLALALYNLVLFLSVRETAYAAYVAYLLSFVTAHATYNGHTFPLFWPDSPVWGNWAHSIFIYLYALFGLLFMINFLDLRRKAPGLYRWTVGFFAILVLSFFATGLLGGYSLHVRSSILWIFAYTPFVLAIGFLSFLSGNTAARYFLTAAAAGFIGSFITAITVSGFFPYSFLAFHAADLGMVFDAILLSLAMADRLRLARREAEKANARLRDLHRIKDDFLANTSHELRTSLNGIIGIAESLKDGVAGEPNEATRRNLNLIIGSGRRLSNLINDILDFSRLRNRSILLNKKPVDLRELIESAASLTSPLTAGKALRLEREIAPDLPLVFADEDRLQQILLNLLGNAVKFTPEGRVLVKAEVDPEDAAMARLSVRDTGIGIPQDKLDLIFESFEQADASRDRMFEGAGLGLAITRKLTELHGGRISVESTPGVGSEFRVSLPLARGAVLEKAPETFRAPETPSRNAPGEEIFFSGTENAAAPVDANGADSSETAILIADDDAVNRQVLKNFLNASRFRLLEAVNGEEAVRIARDEKPDLILLDVMMPRLNGFDACRRIRETYDMNEMPVIMLTALNQVQDLNRGFECGANDYVPKPVLREELLARIRSHLRAITLNKAADRFIPREFLRELGKGSIAEINSGDQVRREMTVMFSDIRSYTSIAERLSPEETIAFLNEYLGRMGPTIREHGGFVNQYYGDGIMALFPGGPEDALFTALEMHRRSAEFAGILSPEAGETFRIKIGIHTGELMLGVIGDDRRLEGSVFSDAVNLTSRIEALNKEYGSSTLVSEDAFARLPKPETFAHRYLDRVHVRGRKQRVSVYEILSPEIDAGFEKKMLQRAEFSRAVELFHEGDFAASRTILEEIVRENPLDEAARFYLER